MGPLWQAESLVLDSICLCLCETHPLQPVALPKGHVLRLLSAVQVGTACWDLSSLMKTIGTCDVNCSGHELFPE